MAFSIDLLKDTKLYRSSNQVSDLSGSWFALTPKDTYGYGSITREFKLNKDVKLLNIESNDFYNDFIKKLNEISKINSMIKEKKNIALFPLGFLDYDVYKRCAITIMPTLQISAPDIQLDIISQFIGNRSRFSEYRLDDFLVKILIHIYGNNYDGLIALEPLPNRLMASLQYSELCIFNLNNREYISEISQIHSGGEKKIKIPMITKQYIESPYIDKLVSDVDEYLKTHRSLIEPDLNLDLNLDIKGGMKKVSRFTRKKYRKHPFLT